MSAVKEPSTTQEALRNDYKRDWKKKKKKAARAERTPEQREAAGLAELIKSVSDEYPTLATEINEFLYVLHQRVYQSPDRVKDGILQALRWPADVEDLCEQLGYSELIVLTTLEGLRALGQVEEAPCGHKAEETNGLRGGAERTVWRRTGKAPITADVLP